MFGSRQGESVVKVRGGEVRDPGEDQRGGLLCQLFATF